MKSIIIDEIVFINWVKTDDALVLKNEIKKWILSVIRKSWRCRLTLKEGSELIGILTELKDNLDLTLDILGGEDVISEVYSLENVVTIETVENELSAVLRQ